jgi:hypothetical protein
MIFRNRGISMQSNWKRCALGIVGLCIGIFWTAAATAAEDVPLIDGDLWNKSSRVEKTSYLIGAGNYMTVEYVFQVEAADPKPTSGQSPTADFWNGLDDVSLDELIDTIDDWYAANPNELQVPVLVVIWNEIVEPKIK